MKTYVMPEEGESAMDAYRGRAGQRSGTEHHA